MQLTVPITQYKNTADIQARRSMPAHDADLSRFSPVKHLSVALSCAIVAALVSQLA